MVAITMLTLVLWLLNCWRVCGMREGMRKAGAKMLEPIMKVEVVTPEEYTGGIIGDLTLVVVKFRVRTTRQRNCNRCTCSFGKHVWLYQYLRSMSSGRANLRCSSATMTSTTTISTKSGEIRMDLN